MAGVYCPNCGGVVFGFTKANPHNSECHECDADVTAKWDGTTLVVTWDDTDTGED